MAIRDLSFSDLEIVIALSEFRSVRSLARDRSVSAGQLSKGLKRIELNVGFPLFRRTAGGVSLTPEGVMFKKQAQEILLQLPSLASQRGMGSSRTKTLSVASTNLINTFVLPRVIASLGTKSPDTRFRLLDVAPDQMVALGSRGLIDIAVDLGAHQWTKNWEVKRAGDLVFGLYGRKGHPLGNQANVEQVKRFPFLYPTYLTQNAVRFGNDQCPIPRTQRILGHQTSTAASAMRIAQASDQLLFGPKIVIEGSEGALPLMEIEVAGWDVVRQPVYVAVNLDQVTQRVFKSWIEMMSRVLQRR